MHKERKNSNSMALVRVRTVPIEVRKKPHNILFLTEKLNDDMRLCDTTQIM
jgi:hypothetical protein